jgi:hypothetical protein
MSVASDPTIEPPANVDADDALPSLGLILPVWNDPDGLSGILEQALAIATTGELVQVVIADASSDQRCEALVREKAQAGYPLSYVRCPRPNRGAQLNAGAAAANTDLLLFHHVDVPLTREHCRAARVAAARRGFSAGAYYRKFDLMHRRRQWLERFVRAYNRWGGALYGDQSLFILKRDFNRHGGFRDIALMEDVELSLRLRRNGGITLVDPPVLPSARRHAKRGSLRTSLFNLWITAAFRCGVSPDRLHRWYYGRRKD